MSNFMDGVETRGGVFDGDIFFEVYRRVNATIIWLEPEIVEGGAIQVRRRRLLQDNTQVRDGGFEGGRRLLQDNTQVRDGGFKIVEGGPLFFTRADTYFWLDDNIIGDPLAQLDEAVKSGALNEKMSELMEYNVTAVYATPPIYMQRTLFLDKLESRGVVARGEGVVDKFPDKGTLDPNVDVPGAEKEGPWPFPLLVIIICSIILAMVMASY